MKKKYPFALLLRTLSLALLFALSGCALWESLFSSPSEEEASEMAAGKGAAVVGEWQTVQLTGRWFAKDHYREFTPNGEVMAHPFFDGLPLLDMNDFSLNFFVVTPAQSHFSYGFDLVSGKRYQQRAFCTRYDLWDSYRKRIDFPPYTSGYVPRMLDNLASPQRILVFGRDEFYRLDQEGATHQVRVVGGINEQICLNVPCLDSRSHWLSRLVLIAVDNNDPRLQDVHTLMELKKRIDWEYAIAFWKNERGGKQLDTKTYPFLRLSAEMSAKEVLHYIQDKAHLFQEGELVQMQSSCLRLYDHLWENLGKIKMEEIYRDMEKLLAQLRLKKIDQEAATSEGENNEALNKQRKELATRLQEMAKTQLKDFQRPQNFYKNFQVTETKYGDVLRTCFQYVKSGDILQNHYRHWFFAYLQLVYRTVALGYLPSCSEKAWYKHEILQGGELVAQSSLINEINRCSVHQLDTIFESAVALMVRLRGTGERYLRYVEYDNGVGGTHERLYSWVEDENRQMVCSGQFSSLESAAIDGDLFPNDVAWTKFIFERATNLLLD